MVRLTRAQQQERNRRAVLAAARLEFAERGYAEAKIDRIAERAELTRGAVYSNFPSKRALYLAVLLDGLERRPAAAAPAPDPLGTFARTWLARLPLTDDSPADGHLRLRSLTGVFPDEPGRVALAQLGRLEALLLGLALESPFLSVPSGSVENGGPPDRTSGTLIRRPADAAGSSVPSGSVAPELSVPFGNVETGGPPDGAPMGLSFGGRRVRLAELVLTLLAGAGHRAEQAPGLGDPFDVTRACQHLADLDLADSWDPPHLPFVAPAQSVAEEWTPPPPLPDQVTGDPTGFDADGVLVVLGTQRLGAAEEAVRAARPGERVTVVAVTSDPAELGRLVRLRIADLASCLLPVFGAHRWPRVVLDANGAVAAALGVRDADDTEAAVRVRDSRLVLRAAGRGAGHAVASTPVRAR